MAPCLVTEVVDGKRRVLLEVMLLQAHGMMILVYKDEAPRRAMPWSALRQQTGRKLQQLH